MPPLAYWRNQTVKRDFYGNTVAILEGSPEYIASPANAFSTSEISPTKLIFLFRITSESDQTG